MHDRLVSDILEFVADELGFTANAYVFCCFDTFAFSDCFPFCDCYVNGLSFLHLFAINTLSRMPPLSITVL